MSTRHICFFLVVIIGICTGCANITAPTGGKKDKIPPKLLTVDPPDSQKNVRLKRIELHFDEYVTVGDVSREIHIAPLLPIDPTATALNKHVVVKIVDSLLDSNTTYRISFGNAIKDLHEGNPFSHYTYTFSTGSYFDSLELKGSVINAATGLPDTGNVVVALYSALESDSAVVRHKPKYVVNTDAKGLFVFKGLPHRRFHIYAMKDYNGNLIYDGPAESEMIAFTGDIVQPGDTSVAPVKLRLFEEPLDSATKHSLDSAAATKQKLGKSKQASNALTYSVNIDSSNVNRRLFDITHPINIVFNKTPQLNKDKIKLTYDSSGITVTPEITMSLDTFHVLHINTNWSGNTVYTLKLAKGFAKDTSGADVMPSRYMFRTFEDEDYGKFTINFPKKYVSTEYVLLVKTDKDTVYEKPVTAAPVVISRLKPAKYTFVVIIDKNRNGKWDPGDFFRQIQPEETIPFRKDINLKAGYEDIEDFTGESTPADDNHGLRSDKK